MIASPAELTAKKEQYSRTVAAHRKRILICAGTGCVASGALAVYEEFKRALAELSLPIDVELKHEHEGEEIDISITGCRGLCASAPLVQIEPDGVLYVHVQPEDAAEIIEKASNDEIVERLAYRDRTTDVVYLNPAESPFYRKQRRLVLERCGTIDPESLEDHIAHDGYQALAKAIFGLTPEQVCDEVLASGLRGRGGAGFPAGRKWNFARVVEADQKYIICNGDEGDPGAFMDRSVMEGDPHRVIEGIAIAAYAIGASEGYVYVRAEYPLAVTRLRKAIVDAEANGLLGDNIMGSDFSFHLHIKEGAGAFVCGEETALIASVEGGRGMPRPKPPFPAVSGLWGKPTVINNVETLGNIPGIILNGAAAFRTIGTPQSPGTKTFALSGKIANTGLVEIPMGCTLRELIYEIGGGVPGGKRFKAVQVGGPSGGCLTEEHMDLRLDFDSLAKVGAMIGSGGLVVLDEDNCMVEVAAFFMQFIQNESCGKCVACREGTKQLLGLLTKITEAKGTLEDLAVLEDLALVVKDASLCGLGKTAANPVLTTLRYFRHEYLAHVEENWCPAGKCKAFNVLVIDPVLCKGCTKCVRVCPAGAISGQVKQPHVIDHTLCTRCGLCVSSCAFKAIGEASLKGVATHA
jgi:NADH:ubiquinone oxidoreductase subunit F (NADH-binding)/(2Fe-2S) ferredoxin/NAD-dependent dihydropyrimidine dehydrogenase PreA subunit